MNKKIEKKERKDNNMNLSKKEKEIIDSYIIEEPEEYEEVEEYDYDTDDEYVEIKGNKDFDKIETYEEESTEKKTRKKHKTNPNTVLNIIFIFIISLISIIAIDVVAVKKYEAGPFFAIKLKEYDDGGTKEYYGLGYKVIKYNQLQGRRDMVIGTWGLKYNSNTLEIDAIDLAIEFNDDPTEAFKKFDGKFLKITGVLKMVSHNENSITMGYIDEDGKYTLDIVCDMASEVGVLDNYETNKNITAIGTLSKYNFKSDETPTTLYLKNCFAEQE